ncbi:MAG: beta-galactosidase [Anaerolineales bacterium]|nr:beta-galactosidase [Anaerolineales bacterium]
MAYREASSRLAGEMARRYGQHPAVWMWHVNNEYGCHVHRVLLSRLHSSFSGMAVSRKI